MRFISASFIRSSSFFSRVSSSVSGGLVSSSFTSTLHKDLGGFEGNFTNNRVEYLVPSQSAGGSDDVKVLVISASGDNPRVGIGVNNPLKAFDFKEVSDTTRGGEILIRGSRTTKGAEVNDEAGRINFIIDSGSFSKVETSGSSAEIVALIDDVDKTGIQGSLSLRVSEGKTNAPSQILKIIGDGSLTKTVEVTGSAEFSKNITIKEDLIIGGKINSFITASSGISASGDIETSGDVIATNFVVSENGNLKTVGSGEYVNLQTDQIALGFGSSWSVLIKKDEGFILNEDGGAFGGALVRDFRIEGTSDEHLLFITGGDNAVGIGTSTPDEKLTVNGNIKALGNIIATGDIVAEQYIINSTVTNVTMSFSSGSTIFGDTLDDTHQFTGSIDVNGSITASGEIETNTISTIITVIGSDAATNVDTFATSTYNGAIYDYILKDSTVGARAGQFMVAHDDGDVTFTDVSTKHLSDSTIPEITADISGADVRVRVTNGNGYTFKSFVKKL